MNQKEKNEENEENDEEKNEENEENDEEEEEEEESESFETSSSSDSDEEGVKTFKYHIVIFEYNHFFIAFAESAPPREWFVYDNIIQIYHLFEASRDKPLFVFFANGLEVFTRVKKDRNNPVHDMEIASALDKYGFPKTVLSCFILIMEINVTKTGKKHVDTILTQKRKGYLKEGRLRVQYDNALNVHHTLWSVGFHGTRVNFC